MWERKVVNGPYTMYLQISDLCGHSVAVVPPHFMVTAHLSPLTVRSGGYFFIPPNFCEYIRNMAFCVREVGTA